jgi:protein SCO1/2
MPAGTLRPPAVRAATIMALLAMAACGPPADAPPQVTLDLRGMQPYVPVEKVDFILTDTDGRPFDFRRETRGRLTFLFFGYTYCPDVCPIQMATLAAAMAELEPAERERVEVVMVSVDPDRDTPDRLRDWLAAFDSSFVGVRGPQEDVDEALAFYGYPPTEFGQIEGGGYLVGHPAYVYAFTPDDFGRAMYPATTTRQEWLHDLRILLEREWEGVAGAESAESALEVRDARAPAPPAGDRTALYLSMENRGAEADTLVAIATEVAGRSSLHDMEMTGGVMRMVPIVGGLPIPAGGTVTLEPGARHGMLEDLTRDLVPGGTFEVELTFARAGRVVVSVRVVRYEDLTGG